MRTDDENYEYGGIYEDESDEYIDRYEIEVFDYPEDDEDENALWDDEDTADTDEPPERKRKKRKKEIVFDDTEDADDELSEKAQRQIAKERRLINELEADAEEHPIEDDEDSTEEQPGKETAQTGAAGAGSCPFGGCRQNAKGFSKCHCLVGLAGCQQRTQGALSRAFPQR